ncbi:hypothetical protein [Methanobrevibacter boviskoreani]|uniref:hypothetical protein n=1 Tax=Methanobrevibacter boviskoreani TaxID=1348249 RepID=UPI0023A8712A|nr:hypothetical protein [Methanobrevibacter boviskoreani]MCI6930243.1 hypothetical protein [Methanobrevibacter boviskoreani]MDD6257153.1 hypothetical protein [Methanobrevibacter boviskoreani]
MSEKCSTCGVDLEEGYRQCPNCLKIIKEDLPTCPYCNVSLISQEHPKIIERNKLLIICFIISLIILILENSSFLSWIFYFELVVITILLYYTLNWFINRQA